MQKQLQIVFSTSFISDCYDKMRAPPRNLFSKLHVNGYEFWHLPHTTSNPLPPPKKKKNWNPHVRLKSNTDLHTLSLYY